MINFNVCTAFRIQNTSMAGTVYFTLRFTFSCGGTRFGKFLEDYEFNILIIRIRREEITVKGVI
jgi:hypothetical protein